MSTTVYQRTECRLCGDTKLTLALPLTPTPLADEYVSRRYLSKEQPRYPLDLYLCENCGFLQLLEIVEPEGIYVDYIYETKSSLVLREHFQNYADGVVRRIKPDLGSLVIDIGSNDGTLLKAFQAKGMKVLGIDPAREIARNATEEGVKTLPIFFTAETAQSLLNEYGAATILTCNNLFANVDHLDDMVAGIRTLLAANGVFIFESFYLLDYVRNMVFDFSYHEHLSYFSVNPLVRFFARHGLELIEAERVPTKGGSLRYTVQLAGGPRAVAPSVAELVELETRAGIHRIE